MHFSDTHSSRRWRRHVRTRVFFGVASAASSMRRVRQRASAGVSPHAIDALRRRRAEPGRRGRVRPLRGREGAGHKRLGAKGASTTSVVPPETAEPLGAARLSGAAGWEPGCDERRPAPLALAHYAQMDPRLSLDKRRRARLQPTSWRLRPSSRSPTATSRRARSAGPGRQPCPATRPSAAASCCFSRAPWATPTTTRCCGLYAYRARRATKYLFQRPLRVRVGARTTCVRSCGATAHAIDATSGCVTGRLPQSGVEWAGFAFACRTRAAIFAWCVVFNLAPGGVAPRLVPRKVRRRRVRLNEERPGAVPVLIHDDDATTSDDSVLLPRLAEGRHINRISRLRPSILQAMHTERHQQRRREPSNRSLQRPPEPSRRPPPVTKSGRWASTRRGWARERQRE